MISKLTNYLAAIGITAALSMGAMAFGISTEMAASDQATIEAR